MLGLDGSWTGLDGSGIIVTVGDTGLDSGVDDATMHPDFADHIHGIYSWPRTVQLLHGTLLPTLVH